MSVIVGVPPSSRSQASNASAESLSGAPSRVVAGPPPAPYGSEAAPSVGGTAAGLEMRVEPPRK
ncbi:hypothetical protein C8T65DRAFT_672389 [Cerioporus squamosus]|nr:hypothetical protein C8T65DRAFT_672389 [Cerioporus squamosus]